MAYANRYLLGTIPFTRGTDLIEFYIYIKQKDYVGEAETLLAHFDSMIINRMFDNLEQNILGINFEFEIINNQENWFTYIDLMTATEKKYQVVIYSFVNKQQGPFLFKGFLNVETTEQKYLRFQGLRLTASSYLNKLQNYSPPALETLENTSFIDLIIDLLKGISVDDGAASKIRIHSSLMPSEDWGVQNIAPGNPGYTLFDKCGVYPELFWDNNVERQSSYDVLDKILKITNCYIYWWDDIWYIERYNNIFPTSWVDETYVEKHFVEYNFLTSYTPYSGNTGVWTAPIVFDVTDIHSLLMIEQTQNMSVIPGNKQIILKLSETAQKNFVPSLFKGIAEVDTVRPTIGLRQWRRYHEIGNNLTDWEDVDFPFKDILRSIKRTCSNTPLYDSQAGYIAMGLYCNFKISVKEATQLTLSWKFNGGTEGWANVPPEQMQWRQYFHLRVLNAFGDYVYISYDYENESWFLYDVENLGGVNVYTPIKLFNQGDFDQTTHTYQFSVTIPLFELNKDNNSSVPITLPFSGDYTIQLTIGPCLNKYKNFDWEIVPDSYFGDIEVTASGDSLPDNYIEGTINTDFLDKKEFTVNLFDSDYNYVSAILRGLATYEAFTEVTKQWRASVSDSDMPIADRLLQDKFRFYNVSRQRIQGNVISELFHKPLSLFYDSLQSNKKFLLMGYSHKLNLGAYDFDLLEYDNETEVNLNG